MKKYKLLKDLPLLKAGAIFTINYYGTLYYKDENSSISIIKSNQDEMKKDGTFDEWFEEAIHSRIKMMVQLQREWLKNVLRLATVLRPKKKPRKRLRS